MAEIHTLDVTRIEPRFKHPKIFETFDALGEGEAFVIYNDHDPKPLYYQLLAERGDIFSWEYLEQGPDAWRIRIAKKKLGREEEKVGEIAARDLRKAEVLRNYGIDFCCGGKQSLSEACQAAGVAESEVTRALAEVADKPASPDRDFNNWNLDFLADYIVNVHHKYVMDSFAMLSDLSHKVRQVHGQAHPELIELYGHVTDLLTEMRSHQIKEERVLFPFIREMAVADRDHKPVGNPPFGTVESPVDMMIDDHHEAAAHVKAIEKLTDSYQTPADGCESYRLYFHKLKEFDEDLLQHLHLENNILFPKAVALEKKLLN
jgi:regulator of cell morphogenesis and NO signaling